MDDGLSTFATIMLFFVAALGIASMCLFLYLGYLLLRAIKRSTRWYRRIESNVRVMGAGPYNGLGNTLIKPRYQSRPPARAYPPHESLSNGEVHVVRSFLRARRTRPQHIVEVREYDL